MAKWLSTFLGCLCLLWASITITGCGGSDNNSPQPSSSNSTTSPGFGPGGPGTSPGETTSGTSPGVSTFPTTSPSGPSAGSQLPGSTFPTTSPSGPSAGSQLPGSTFPTTSPSGPSAGSQLPGSTIPTTSPSGPSAGSQLPGSTIPTTSPSGPSAGSQLPGSTIPTTSPSGPSAGSQLPGSTIPKTSPSGPSAGSQLPGSTIPTTSPSGPPAGSQLSGVTAQIALAMTAGISPVMMASTQRSTGVVRQILLAEDSTRDIYVRGDFVNYQGSAANELIRLHADGSVANRFGQGFDGPIYRIALANTGGGLYVSGAFAHFDGQSVSHVVRLTRTGALDPAFRFIADFDPGGIVVAEDGSGDVYSVHSGPDLNCGQCAYALQIARLNADGSLDPAFSTGHGFPGGLPPNANPAWIQALLPTSNGKLSVGGSLLSYNGVAVSSLVRLNVDGTLDTTFMSNVGYTSDPVVEVIAPVAPGTQDIYIGGQIGLFRVLATGAFDTSFTAAVPMITFSIAPVQDGTGDLYVSGVAGNRIRLLRFNRNGAVVSTFQEPNLDAEVLTIVPLPDGTRDLYIGGAFTTYSGVAVNHIARVHADGSLASTFSGP